jgi:hypothetical protein
LINDVRLARRAKLFDIAIARAFDIGALATMWMMKVTVEPVWDKGRRVVAGGVKGAEAKHGPAEVKKKKHREIKAILY